MHSILPNARFWHLAVRTHAMSYPQRRRKDASTTGTLVRTTWIFTLLLLVVQYLPFVAFAEICAKATGKYVCLDLCQSYR